MTRLERHLAACKTLARRLGQAFCCIYSSERVNRSNASLQQSFPTARTSACCETARARTLSLKTQHRSPSRHSCARGARARCATYLTRAAEQRPVSHFSARAGTSERAPPRARRQKARSSAGKQHHQHFCLTTFITAKHERRTSPRQCVHTKLKSSPSRRMGLSALRKFFSDSCLEKPGLV